jgi:hypothetical protein
MAVVVCKQVTSVDPRNSSTAEVGRSGREGGESGRRRHSVPGRDLALTLAQRATELAPASVQDMLDGVYCRKHLWHGYATRTSNEFVRSTASRRERKRYQESARQQRQRFSGAL